MVEPNISSKKGLANDPRGGGAAVVLLSLAILAFTSTLHRELLARSLFLAGSAALLSTIWGTLLAVCLVRTAIVGRRVAMAMIIAAMLLPLYVHLASWEAMLGRLGWLSVATASPDRPWMSGMGAAIWIHAVALLPWATSIVLVRLAAIDPRLEEQALLEQPPSLVLLHVTLPRILGAAVMALVWGMVTTIGEMTVTNVYLVNTFTEHLYSRLALAAGLEEILPSLVPLLAGLLLVISSLFAVLLQLRLAEAWQTRQRRLLITSKMGRTIGSLVVLISLVLAMLLPTVNLLSQAGLVVETTSAGEPLRTWSPLAAARVVLESPWQFRREFLWSITLALQASTACAVVSLAIAWIASRSRAGWMLLSLVAAIGLGIPGPIVGMLLGILRGESSGLAARAMDETMLLPIIAQSLRIVPLQSLLLWQAMATIDRRKLDAAALDGYRPLSAMIRILISQRRLALLSAWLLGIAISWGELSCSLLVLPPGVDTITRRVFGLVHYGVDQQVAGISLLMLLAYTAVAAVLLLTTERDSGAIPQKQS